MHLARGVYDVFLDGGTSIPSAHEVSDMELSTFPLHARRVRPLTVLVLALLLSTVAAAGPAGAASLTPPPPSFERCHSAGVQTICEGNVVFGGGIEGAGIICGSGPDAFEVFDHSDKVLEHAARWYDADGNLTRRMIKDTWLGSEWTNPLTGKAVSYRQTIVVTDVLAIPGDTGSARETTTGVVNFIIPGKGAFVQDVGRTVFNFDGTLESQAGSHVFVDYFVNGDTTALDPICSVLAG